MSAIAKRVVAKVIIFQGILLLAGCGTMPPVELTHEQFVVPATINGEPARFLLDTGAANLMLFRSSADRLGIKITRKASTDPPESGTIPYALTERYWMRTPGGVVRTRFAVIDVPVHPEFDGAIGWPQLRHLVFQIDVASKTFRVLRRVPPEVQGWTAIPLQEKSGLLALEISGQQGTGAVLIDTGAEGGVYLARERWRKWSAAHPDRRKTLNAYYNPVAGVVVAEEAWAEDLTLGPIKLTDIPIGEPDDAGLVPGAEFQAALGIAALRRLDLIVDGPHHIAYLQPRQSPAPPYSHNRAGAVFLPPDFQRTNLFARVLEGSPAYRAGIRDGDEVLKVNGKDVLDWRTYGNSMESCWESPAGTELRFTLKRGETNFETTVVLQELLGPQR